MKKFKTDEEWQKEMDFFRDKLYNIYILIAQNYIGDALCSLGTLYAIVREHERKLQDITGVKLD